MVDMNQINEVLGLASSAVGVTGKAASTVSALKALFESDKTVGSDETTALLNSLATELTSANIMNVQLSDAIRDLSSELRKQDAFEVQKQRYELFETGQRDIVFKLREDASDGQPIHFICPVCLNKDNLISYITGEEDYKRCQTNNNHLYTFNYTPMSSESESTFY